MNPQINTTDDPIARAFSPMYGKPCWNAEKGYSSFLTFEFGEPRLEIEDPRERAYYLTPKKQLKLPQRWVSVRGKWHLWIYCCDWSIRLGGKQIAHSESASRRIERAIGILNGQALTQVSVDSRDAKSSFQFDLGGELITWPYDKLSEQWMLFEPSAYVLSVRADGQFSHQLGSTHPDQEVWHPLERR